MAGTVKVLCCNQKTYISTEELERILKEDLIYSLEDPYEHSDAEYIKDLIARISKL